jgi:hypothetical protein
MAVSTGAMAASHRKEEFPLTAHCDRHALWDVAVTVKSQHVILSPIIVPGRHRLSNSLRLTGGSQELSEVLGQDMANRKVKIFNLSVVPRRHRQNNSHQVLQPASSKADETDGDRTPSVGIFDGS